MSLWYFFGWLLFAGSLATVLAERRAGWNAASYYASSGIGLFAAFAIAWYFIGDMYTAQIVAGALSLLWIASAALATKHPTS